MSNQFAMVPMDLITNTQIHHSAFRVYAMLAMSVNSSDSKAASWVSTRSLARDLDMAPRTVRQALVDLKAQGWLTEIPESDWLPRWREILADRVQTVRVYGLPRHPTKQREEQPPKTVKEGTHAWVLSKFEEGASHHGGGVNKGLVASVAKELRAEGYSNEEIVRMVETFFVRYEHDIRSRKNDLNIAQMFRHNLPHLKEQTKAEIRDKREGRKTTKERSAELQADLRKRLAAS